MSINRIFTDKDINDCGDCWPITPITLAPEDFDHKSQSHYRALGWGAFDHTRQASQYLRELNLTLNYEKTKGNVAADRYFLWTEVGHDGQDTCAGDSGKYIIV